MRPPGESAKGWVAVCVGGGQTVNSGEGVTRPVEQRPSTQVRNRDDADNLLSSLLPMVDYHQL